MEGVALATSYTTTHKAHYSPPWADMNLVGIAGSSGSGKTSLAIEIIKALDLPWVVLLSMDSFYKSLTPEQNALAHANEYDLDTPNSIDFDLLVEKLKELKQGSVVSERQSSEREEQSNIFPGRKRTDIPIYSFQEHQRLSKTLSIYSPHVVILEGILALHDPRILEMLDMKIFVEADGDLCLSRRIVRDVRERGRTIEGVIKQWFAYVKPAFVQHVEPQRHVADVVVPRGMQNKMAITMIVNQTRHLLKDKSRRHNAELAMLGKQVEEEPLSANITLMQKTPQLRGVVTILRNINTPHVDFVFYMDRLSSLLVEKALDCHSFNPVKIKTPQNYTYRGLESAGTVSAVVILRGGSCMETGLKRTIPDCLTGRMLIQSNYRTGEPELHYLKLFPDISKHKTVLLLDPQMSRGGAALMAVKVLIDHGVTENKIVFVTCLAGKMGANRLLSVFPDINVVAANVVDDGEKRWIEERYLGC